MPPPSQREAQYVCCIDSAHLSVNDARVDRRLSAYSERTLYRWREEYKVRQELPVDTSKRQKQVVGRKIPEEKEGARTRSVKHSIGAIQKEL